LDGDIDDYYNQPVEELKAKINLTTSKQEIKEAGSIDPQEVKNNEKELKPTDLPDK
jgi:hypothetical protein